MRVALYARCSTRKQDLDGQAQQLKAWATRKGYDFFLFEDFAVSGRQDSRAGINALLEAANLKEFELVGIVELSRLGRSIGFIHHTVETLSKLGIKIVLVNSETTLDYNAMEGRALIGGLALAADIEWLLIQERNERGRAKIRESGVKVGRKPRDISLKAIDALRQQGFGVRKIAKELGVSAPTVWRRIKTGQLSNVSNSSTETDKTVPKPQGLETVLQGG
ncbi:recombinase family protein [Candidatus Micrarchaeota archaeon]|nr:recombinase family protein [Candidatus Micrarchaeota archaeon]